MQYTHKMLQLALSLPTFYSIETRKFSYYTKKKTSYRLE